MKNIGLLLEGVAGLYYSGLWTGIVERAKKNGYNVICFAGGTLRVGPQDPYEVQRNVIYDFVDVSKLQGLIFSGTLKNFISELEFAEFLERFSGLPMISLTPTLAHIPSLVVDNSSGMKSLISHLAGDHKCSNFAFIGGPKGNLDADQRLDLFRKYLAEYGVECHEDLVTAGDFTRKSGYKAAIELLKKGIKFDALIAANDETALGAMEALLDNDVRVPEDTAITGFDCIEESELTTPPLTTVRQPLYEIGSTAVELLLASIKGENIPMRTVLQTPLVIRQSCGCYINPKHSLDSRMRNLTIIKDLSDSIESRKVQLTDALYSFIAEMGSIAAFEDDSLSELAATYFDEIKGTRTDVFMPTLNRIVRTAALACEDGEHDILQWQKILAIIRKAANGLSGAELETAINLTHNGYNLFGETAARQQAYKRLQAEQKADRLRSVGFSIANTFDIPDLTQAIAGVFPELGINDFYLSLYDQSTQTFENSKPIIGLCDGEANIPPPGALFQTKRLVPGEIEDFDEPFQVLVQPLHFKDVQLGMAIFKDSPLTGYIYDILGDHLSGALQGALLMEKIKEQHEELKILREKEQLRLEAIEKELQIGRSIQESFLPETMPKIPGWDSSAFFLPAREVSGDFYDAFKLEDGRIAFIVADVSGKDVGAALFMALIRSLLRAFSEQLTDTTDGATNPLDAVELTNRYVVNHHHTLKGRFMYATMFFAVVDPETGEVTYINAGHNPQPLLQPSGKIARWLPPTAPAVGVGLSDDLKYNQVKFILEPGEIILLYTDGIIEAKNDKGEFLEQKRFAELIEQPYNSLGEVISRIRNALDEHSAGTDPYDDVTLMGIYRKPE
ncbi:MAG: SpoIIE family protein phosphatase [Chitinispirillales bacterium]|jgi:serine phosphatase RsbU (regulator of sigma subunit)/DNA-binding LacI/PurR family transcriptional regulator|nr:SpoIIE family protein phosphatase [Chitinispirillales bacterium]